MAKTDASLLVMLMRAHARAQELAFELLEDCGVTPLEQWLLEAIPDDGVICASELASVLDVPTSTVTRALRRLEQQQWVTLQKGTFLDARILRPQLTAAGRLIRKSGTGFEAEVDRHLVDGLDSQVAAWLLRGLAPVADPPPRPLREPTQPRPPREPREPREPRLSARVVPPDPDADDLDDAIALWDIYGDA